MDAWVERHVNFAFLQPGRIDRSQERSEGVREKGTQGARERGHKNLLCLTNMSYASRATNQHQLTCTFLTWHGSRGSSCGQQSLGIAAAAAATETAPVGHQRRPAIN